jgi:hypothetical protein
MPADIPGLIATLVNMKATYVADPKVAVRSAKFIAPLHEYCRQELIRVGFAEGQLRTEAVILGSHKPKKVDVAIIDKNNGPLAIVGIRSQMSSVAKNMLTYYEEIIGDVISLHDRYPMAIIGYVYLLPTNSIKPGFEHEVPNLARAEQLYALITDRGDWRNTKDKYEHFAFLKADFRQNPPTLQGTLPSLDITSFFDNIYATHTTRNLAIQI